MIPREKFVMALEGKQPPGRVPHFELIFSLTMEAFGKVHPRHRYYNQWNQMSESERKLHRNDIADLYIQIAQTYEHSAIFFQPPRELGACEDEESVRMMELIKEKTDGKYFLMVHGDATYSVPSGDKMMDFVTDIAERPEQIKDNASRRIEAALERGAFFQKSGILDCFCLCADYCINNGPFLSPAMFDEFVTPYLADLIKGYREMGFYVIKHSDGNIMPILNSIVSANPHALHSIDPQGGVDIAEVKKLVGDRVCLIGNVNCGLMDTGTDEDVIESARYALKNGMPGGGYIFSTSNTVYTGMRLERYEMILDVWRKEGNYS